MRRTDFIRMKFLIALLVVTLAGFSSSALAVDHSEFFEGPMNSGPDVTKACLECHDEAASQVMKTTHWTWSSEQVIEGKQVNRGKINALNNF